MIAKKFIASVKQNNMTVLKTGDTKSISNEDSQILVVYVPSNKQTHF